MAWGIFPLFFAAHGMAIADIGVIKATYPFVWALGQLVTGPLSDRWGRKRLIVLGMWVQALAHPVIAIGASFSAWAFGVSGAILLGLGTAMVYPALLAAVSDVAHPAWRARSLSVYRSWRDLGYAVGATICWICRRCLRLGMVDSRSRPSDVHFGGGCLADGSRNQAFEVKRRYRHDEDENDNKNRRGSCHVLETMSFRKCKFAL
jgi:hypothetical protein